MLKEHWKTSENIFLFITIRNEIPMTIPPFLHDHVNSFCKVMVGITFYNNLRNRFCRQKYTDFYVLSTKGKPQEKPWWNYFCVCKVPWCTLVCQVLLICYGTFDLQFDSSSTIISLFWNSYYGPFFLHV